MKFFSPGFSKFSSVSIAATLVAAATVLAIPTDSNAEPVAGFELAQAQYDIFVDRTGRRFLVDPYTGDIVGPARRNRNFKRRNLRQERWNNRRGRSLERELSDLLYLRDYDDEDRPRRRARRRYDDGGFYLDEYERERPRAKRNRNERRAKTRSQRRKALKQQTVRRRALPKIKKEQRVASLPRSNRAIESSVSASQAGKPNYDREQMTRLQVFLDREGFSPGVIDGKWGTNVFNATKAWKQANGDIDLGNIGVLEKIAARSGRAIKASYTISRDDVRGPFVSRVPIDYARKALLKNLSYTGVTEMLAERFHMSEAYLLELNPGKDFGRPGTVLTVIAPGVRKTEKVHRVVADKSSKQVRGYSRSGKLLVAYPATIGSASTPSPSGTHSVARIALNPEYTYNPKINFQQGTNNKILRIPPGPNGPVGSVWIALSKPTYGIHGTPNPDKIGKTNSHGCIRLTNWDARELAGLVAQGTAVEFTE